MGNFNRLFRTDILRIIFPSMLTVMFFVAAIFGFTLPFLKNNFMEQKKLLIVSETQTVLSIVNYYEHQVTTGDLSLKMAQTLAIEQIRGLRYGLEGKDYFWIIDMQPKALLNPYQSEIEGQDLSNYSDINGKLLFKENIFALKRLWKRDLL